MSKVGAAEIAGNCVAVRLRALTRVVTGQYDDALRPLGLKVSQLNVLVAAEQSGGASAAELCARLHMDASTFSRNADRMRSRGWLTDAPGRGGPVRVTPAGRKLIAKAGPLWKAAQDEVVKTLGRELVGGLRAAVNLEGDADEA